MSELKPYQKSALDSATDRHILDAIKRVTGLLADIAGSYVTPEKALEHSESWGETRRRILECQGELFNIVLAKDPEYYGFRPLPNLAVAKHGPKRSFGFTRGAYPPIECPKVKYSESISEIIDQVLATPEGVEALEELNAEYDAQIPDGSIATHRRTRVYFTAKCVTCGNSFFDYHYIAADQQQECPKCDIPF